MTRSGAPASGRPAAAPGGSAPRRAGTPTPARLLALRVLVRVERRGAYADRALHAALGRGRLARADRALATELVYGSLRWRGRLDFLLARVCHRPVERLEPIVRCALRLGAYQLAFSDRIPASAAVDESVRCVRAAGSERAAGLVNAALRRLASELPALEPPALDADPLGHLEHALSLPAWLAARWLALLGPERAAALARAQNRPAPVTLRANRRRTSRAALMDELRARGLDPWPCRLAPDGIRVRGFASPGEDPAFREGRFTVQDEAAQLVIELLDPQPGEQVVDACAAPGAKSTAIAERLDGRGGVLCLDRHRGRLALLGRDARRLGLANLALGHADASDPRTALPEQADRVLVDAPCSGLGTLRRHPDLRWRVQPDDPAALALTQLALVRRCATAVRPGGILLYSTCTLLPDENEDVIERFLRESPRFRRTPRRELPARLDPLLDADGTLRCWPHEHDTDGFYAVRLERLP